MKIQNQPKRKKSRFRDINVYLYASDVAQKLPDTATTIAGEDPRLFVVTRWHPAESPDKARSTMLPERRYGWVPTADPRVYYGLERWGDVVPNNYEEWFSIAILHPVLTNPADALRICEAAPPGGAPRDEYG